MTQQLGLPTVYEDSISSITPVSIIWVILCDNFNMLIKLFFHYNYFQLEGMQLI